MNDMLISFGDVHHGMGSPGIVAFMTMWITMMIAMMFPVVAPMVALHRVTARARGDGPASTAVFAGGYLLVWAAIGILPAVLFAALPGVTNDLGASVMRVAGGALIVLAGVYQLTGWKEACLRSCRHPLMFLMTHDSSKRFLGALRAGASHSVYCVGCCIGLMVVLIVVGVGNLMWMALLTGVFLLERDWRHGEKLARTLAPVLVVVGVMFAASAIA